MKLIQKCALAATSFATFFGVLTAIALAGIVYFWVPAGAQTAYVGSNGQIYIVNVAGMQSSWVSISVSGNGGVVSFDDAYGNQIGGYYTVSTSPPGTAGRTYMPGLQL